MLDVQTLTPSISTIKHFSESKDLNKRNTKKQISSLTGAAESATKQTIAADTTHAIDGNAASDVDQAANKSKIRPRGNSQKKLFMLNTNDCLTTSAGSSDQLPHLYAEIEVPLKMSKRSPSSTSTATTTTAATAISSLTGRSSLFGDPNVAQEDASSAPGTENSAGIMSSLVGAWNEAMKSTCSCFDLGCDENGKKVAGSIESERKNMDTKNSIAMAKNDDTNHGDTVSKSGTVPTFSEPVLDI